MSALKAYFDGINAERYEEVGQLFAENGELTAPGTGPYRGRAAIASYFKAALKPYPVHLDDPGRILLSGDSATVEIHFSGRTDGGFALEFDAIDVFDFDAEGKISRLSSWYDSHTVRKALREARAASQAPTR